MSAYPRRGNLTRSSIDGPTAGFPYGLGRQMSAEHRRGFLMGDRVVTPMGVPIPDYFVTFVTGLYATAPPALYSKRTLKWVFSAARRL